MNKFSFAAVSLIGAIPGGYFAYMMVMAMLGYFKDMTNLMRAVTCTALAMSALMAVMPIGIIIFMSKPKTDDDEAESKSEADDAGDEAEDVEASEIDEELGSFDDLETKPVTKPGAGGDAESEESVVIDTEGMFDEDIYEADEMDEFDEEEETPKKKKKDKKKKKK